MQELNYKDGRLFGFVDTLIQGWALTCIMPSFSSCLSSKVVKEERLSRDSHEILLDEDGSKPGCPFCNVTRERGFDVVLETPRLIAFRGALTPNGLTPRSKSD